jgi:hypothetical protein
MAFDIVSSDIAHKQPLTINEIMRFTDISSHVQRVLGAPPDK